MSFLSLPPIPPAPAKPSFASSVMSVAGHIGFAAVLFAFIAVIAWGLGYGLSWLHNIHHFPDLIYQALQFIEYGLFAIDVLLAAFLVVVGAAKFAKEVWGGH